MKQTKGFSVVELLVYTVSMTLVLGAVTFAAVQVYGFYASAIVESRADRALALRTDVLSSLKMGVRYTSLRKI